MTIRHLEPGRATYITGDVHDALTATPDASIDLVLTSPPFLALRSYLPADHPDKHREIGSEPDPATFLDTLLALTAEWRRVLAPHGSICVELGDTYSGSGSGGGWPLPKSLCGIPHLYHLSLAYGRNLLTGEPSPAGQWRVRNVVAWCRPNPPVGFLGDKFRPATSYLTIACPSGSRYFDLDAVRYATDRDDCGGLRKGTPGGTDERRTMAGESAQMSGSNPAGAPPRDWWEIPAQPYSGAHYAAFPPALVERPIKSMTPRKVCRTCGQPSRRIVDRTEEYAAARAAVGSFKAGRGSSTGLNGTTQYVNGKHIEAAEHVTIGWSDCGHDDWRPGIVLDPFAGSGTTLMVATGLGHAALGFDLDPRNVDLARGRVGPMLLDEHTLADLTTEAAS